MGYNVTILERRGKRKVAVKDTHKAFEPLTDAGYSKEMAEALLETLSESWDALATKTEIDAVRGDIKASEVATKAEVDAVRGDAKDLGKETKANLRELELRMRLQLYAVAIVVIGVLAALELIPR